jgi:hypothetical protein
MVGKKGCVPIIDYKQKEKATKNFKEVVLGVSYISIRTRSSTLGCEDYIDTLLNGVIKKLKDHHVIIL